MTDEHSNTTTPDPEFLKRGSTGLPQFVHNRIQEWTGRPCTDLCLVERREDATPFTVQNSYAVTFGKETPRIRGRGKHGMEVSDAHALIRHVHDDIETMTRALASTAMARIGAESPVFTPELDPKVIQATGSMAFFNATCNECGGTTKCTCTQCRGTRQVNCHAGCAGGQQKCPSCSGTGSRTESCPQCGGSGRDRMQAATWDYQKQQNAPGGMGMECGACFGRGGKPVPCYACSGGYKVCNACSGQGYTQCSRCDFSGKVHCNACLEGYVHTTYSPQVNVECATDILIPEGLNADQERIAKLDRARAADLWRFAEKAHFEQHDAVLLRTHKVAIHFSCYTMDTGHGEYTILTSEERSQVLDFGGFGDALLSAPADPGAVTDPGAKNSAGLADCVRSPAHVMVIGMLAVQIGLATLVPGFKPKRKTIDTELVAKTSNFVTGDFGVALVNQVAKAMRAALLMSHGIGLLVSLIVLSLIGVVSRIELVTIDPAQVRSLLPQVIALLLVAAEIALLVRVIQDTKAAPKGARLPVVAALVLKNVAHWFCLAFYPILLWVFFAMV